MGDWCGHLFDTAVWSLDLGAPTSIEPQWDGGDVSEVAWQSAIIKFQFPSRGKSLPPVTLTWYDGGNKPPRPEELDPGEELPREGGYLFVGSKGKLVAVGRSWPQIVPRVRPWMAFA
jgi:hypothetical protein